MIPRNPGRRASSATLRAGPRRALLTLAMAASAFVIAASLAVPEPANATAIRPGFNSTALPGNDDGSFAESLGFTANFFGVSFTSFFLNNNGNVTFGSSLAAFNPAGFVTLGVPIIAPFFADVDTRFAGSPVTFGSGTVGGHSAVGINWIDVARFCFSSADTACLTPRNSFQLLLIDRSDTGAGNFAIEFNYDQIQWDLGQASGTAAFVGFSKGTGNPGTFVVFPGSGVSGALLDSNQSTGLIHGREDENNILGRYDFTVENGALPVPTCLTCAAAVPEPGTLMILGAGLVGLAGIAWRRAHRK